MPSHIHSEPTATIGVLYCLGSDNNNGGHSTSDDNAVDYFLVSSRSDQIVLDAPSQNYRFPFNYSSTSVFQGTPR